MRGSGCPGCSRAAPGLDLPLAPAPRFSLAPAQVQQNPQLRFSSGSGKGQRLSPTLCFEDGRTLSTVTVASSHRNRAKTSTEVEAGLFAPPWSPNSPCPRSWPCHEGAALPKVLRSINLSPPGHWWLQLCPPPRTCRGCWGKEMGKKSPSPVLDVALAQARACCHLPQCDMCVCPQLQRTHLSRCSCYRPRPAQPWGSRRPPPQGSGTG